MMDKKAFYQVYHEVFDKDGKVTNCGRDKCIELIHLSKQLTSIYGNEKYGIMNIDAIKKLYVELFPNWYLGDPFE